MSIYSTHTSSGRATNALVVLHIVRHALENDVQLKHCVLTHMRCDTTAIISFEIIFAYSTAPFVSGCNLLLIVHSTVTNTEYWQHSLSTHATQKERIINWMPIVCMCVCKRNPCANATRFIAQHLPNSISRIGSHDGCCWFYVWATHAGIHCESETIKIYMATATHIKKTMHLRWIETLRMASVWLCRSRCHCRWCRHSYTPW